MSERKVSLLTNPQRELLTEESKQNASHERAMRSRMRRRVREGFRDLELIVQASSQGDLDINEILRARESDKTLAEQSQQNHDESRLPTPWPLAALLFLWASKNPQLLDRSDFSEFVDPITDATPQQQMDRVTASFDNQIETGVRAALEFAEWDQVPEAIDNSLTVSLGQDVSELSDEELAELPRRTLDILFRRGDIDNEEYAEIMQLRFEKNEMSGGYRTSMEEIQSYGGLRAFIEQKEKENEEE